MPGGLINIVSYGSQDLFLTGAPEITYFKVVYRRYTNFSIESIRLKFDDDVSFNKYSTLVFPKTGDLLHKMSLEIIIPEISFRRQINSVKSKKLYTIYENYLSEYEIINNFLKINMNLYRNAIITYSLDNVINSNDIISSIIDTYNLNINSQLYNNFKNILDKLILTNKSSISDKYILNKFIFSDIDLYTIANNATNEMIENKELFKAIIDNSMKLCTLLVSYYQELIYNAKLNYDNELNYNYKFAWVKRLGHSMIDYVDIQIGGDIIDKHYGEWIDIWYELTTNINFETSYMQLIGNTDELTTFDRNTKPKTTLYVPLKFWFNRFNGSALPIIALQYDNIQLGIKLRKFSEISYIETTNDLDNLFEENNLQINMNLLVDYVFLDATERRKMACTGHEYLIDVIQTQFETTDIEEFKTRLEFTNLSKELIWVVQKKSKLTNKNGTNNCEWTNYGIYSNNKGNPCKKSQVFLNGNEIAGNYDGVYFNYYIPYHIHTKTPSDGVNVFSFSMTPEEHQPSGSCNMSRLQNTQLIINIDNDMFINSNIDTQEREIVVVKIFSLSQNILRIFNGMCKLAFT